MKGNLFFIAICLISVNLYSQAPMGSSKLSFTHEPFYMTKNMLKIDVDIALGNGNWLVISPVFAARENPAQEDDYYYYDDYYSDEYNKLIGYGLTLGHRIYGNTQPKGFYFSYQAGWKHFQMDYRNRSWGNIDFDGYDAITYDLFNMSTLIDKIGLDILVGYQLLIKDALILDFYFGGGIRYSFREFTGNLEKEFNSSITDYGYTGLLPQGGVRLGVVL